VSGYSILSLPGLTSWETVTMMAGVDGMDRPRPGDGADGQRPGRMGQRTGSMGQRMEKR
jgi:hypothetical protein